MAEPRASAIGDWTESRGTFVRGAAEAGRRAGARRAVQPDVASCRARLPGRASRTPLPAGARKFDQRRV